MSCQISFAPYTTAHVNECVHQACAWHCNQLVQSTDAAVWMCIRPVESVDEENMRQLLEQAQQSQHTRKLQRRMSELWHKPFFEGCPSTVLQTRYERLHTAVSTRSKDVSVNTECRASCAVSAPRQLVSQVTVYDGEGEHAQHYSTLAVAKASMSMTA